MSVSKFLSTKQWYIKVNQAITTVKKITYKYSFDEYKTNIYL